MHFLFESHGGGLKNQHIKNQGAFLPQYCRKVFYTFFHLHSSQILLLCFKNVQFIQKISYGEMFLFFNGFTFLAKNITNNSEKK